MEFLSNNQLKLAHDFVEYTGTHVYLTGRAGTGKTTFLHYMRNHSLKRSIVVAPTGVAAINAGGVTIHSFFQLPFGILLPDDGQQGFQGDKVSEKRFLKLNRDKIKIIRSLDLLIIDEVSMVRADLLDGIDRVLRRYRDRTKPFGGVQLLLIGDLQQLPPVVREEERSILQQYYSSFFFFGSHALRQTSYISIELKKIYRQTDNRFIGLLNKVRDNALDPMALKILNERYRHDVGHLQTDGYITLTTHNHQAKAINDKRLEKIKKTKKYYTARVEGDFPETSYPTEHKLLLKRSAQVMFVKNDPSPDKLFYNGKIGRVTGMDDDVVYVQCDEDGEEIAVTPLTWENTRYALDEQTKEIKETVAGSFTQFPLKLAWAITIHKSQGLTFEKAIIDAQAAFAHGQVYVALSRCKTLDGMVLSSQVAARSVKSDESIKDFSLSVERNQPDENQLYAAKLQFQYELLEELFNFSPISYWMSRVARYAEENPASFDQNTLSSAKSCISMMRNELVDVAMKFNREIKKHAASQQQIENNELLQQRIRKACGYFSPRLQQGVIECMDKLDLEVDNQQLRKSVNDAYKRFSQEAGVKKACLDLCQSGFYLASYLETRAKAAIDLESPPKKKKSRSSVADETSNHPQLYEQIRVWRNRVMKETERPAYMILPRKSMVAISNELPGTKKRLGEIHGLGKKKVEEFGEDIISLVLDYCVNNDVEPAYKTLPGEKARKSSTVQTSFEMFKSGKSVDAIALTRGLKKETIENHLVNFIKAGDISIGEMVSSAKTEKVMEYLGKNTTDRSLGQLKKAMGDAYSWFELRAVLAYEEFLRKKNQ